MTRPRPPKGCQAIEEEEEDIRLLVLAGNKLGTICTSA
jgi:hypothetical protein